MCFEDRGLSSRADQEVKVVAVRHHFMAAVWAVHMAWQLHHRAALVQV